MQGEQNNPNAIWDAIEEEAGKIPCSQPMQWQSANVNAGTFTCACPEYTKGFWAGLKAAAADPTWVPYGQDMIDRGVDTAPVTKIISHFLGKIAE